MSARYVVPTCSLGDKLSLGYHTFNKIDRKILCLRLDLEAEVILTFFGQISATSNLRKNIFLVYSRFFGVWFQILK